ncbi:MAG: hypothetical protein ACM3Y9_04770 [Ignavibacteria bacterium]
MPRSLVAVPLLAVLISTAYAEDRAQSQREMERHAMSASEISLHDLMEPIWRAPRAEAPGRACANTVAIQARVDAAVGAKGSGAFLPMSKTANELTRACKEKRTQDVPRLLDDLHQQFHKMIGVE